MYGFGPTVTTKRNRAMNAPNPPSGANDPKSDTPPSDTDNSKAMSPPLGDELANLIDGFSHEIDQIEPTPVEDDPVLPDTG